MEDAPPVEVPGRRKHLLWWALLVFATTFLAWLMRPYPEIDEAKVHPALRGLDETTEFVDYGSIGDGGTRRFRIMRPDGSEVKLCMSNSLDHSFFQRGQLYVGADYFDDPAAVNVTGYDHTRFVFAKLLGKHPYSGKFRQEIALMTKRLPDWLSFMAEDGLARTYDSLRIFE